MIHNLKPQLHQPETIILQERIRQARWAFNLSIAFSSVSVVITIAGVVLLTTGQISQGGYVALGGLTSTAVGHRCVQFSREANDRLDRLIQEQNETEELEA